MAATDDLLQMAPEVVGMKKRRAMYEIATASGTSATRMATIQSRTESAPGSGSRRTMAMAPGATVQIGASLKIRSRY